MQGEDDARLRRAAGRCRGSRASRCGGHGASSPRRARRRPPRPTTTTRQASSGSSSSVAPAPVFVTLRTGQPKLMSTSRRRRPRPCARLRHRVGFERRSGSRADARPTRRAGSRASSRCDARCLRMRPSPSTEAAPKRRPWRRNACTLTPAIGASTSRVAPRRPRWTSFPSVDLHGVHGSSMPFAPERRGSYPSDRPDARARLRPVPQHPGGQLEEVSHTLRLRGADAGARGPANR